MHTIASNLNTLAARKTHLNPPRMLSHWDVCAMQHCHLWIRVMSPSLFILHHVVACVRPDAAAWTRLSSGGNSSPLTTRPVAFPAQWSPGSSLDLWCKSFFISLQHALSKGRAMINCDSWLLRVFEPFSDGAGAPAICLVLNQNQTSVCGESRCGSINFWLENNPNSSGLYFAMSAGMLR